MVFYNSKIVNRNASCSISTLLEMVAFPKVFHNLLANSWCLTQELDYCYSLFSYPQHPFLVVRNKKNKFIILDGMNRFFAIRNFINSSYFDFSKRKFFPVTKQESFVQTVSQEKIINSTFYFSDLSPAKKKYFLNSILIPVIEIDINLDEKNILITKKILENIMKNFTYSKVGYSFGSYLNRLNNI